MNGIPHLELFDAGGTAMGRAIGARSWAELDSLAIALMENQPLPVLARVGTTSCLAEQPPGEASTAGAICRRAAAAPRHRR